MKYSDETLAGFLDGTLPKATAQQLEQDMTGDAELQRRMMRLDKAAPMVSSTFGDLPGSARLSRLADSLVQENEGRRFRGWKPVAWAASIFLAVLFGWFQPFDREEEDWRLAVAQYQALYVPETIALIDEDPIRIKAELSNASKALDINLSQLALSKIEDLKLKRTQILGYRGKLLIQVVYADGNGKPIALCMMRKDGGKTGTGSIGGLSSYSWTTNSHQFLVVGKIDQNLLDQLASEMKKRLQSAI